MNENSEHDKIQELINSGSDIVGAATGGILGFFVAGPLGAAAGSAGGTIVAKGLSKIGKELKQRVLGNREEARIGATVSYAVLKIQENLSKGKTIREDDFFKNEINSRTDADEVLEGILISSQKEYEEKKLKYLGNLLGNISFDENINKPFANQLIRLGESLSYHQLCLLKIFFQSGNLKEIELRKENYRDSKPFSRELVTILYDILEIEKMSLIINSENQVLGLTDIIPSQFAVQGNGNALVKLMELKTIPEEDCSKMKNILSE